MFAISIIGITVLGLILSPVAFGAMIDSPRKQMVMGTSAEDVVCKAGMALMKRSSGTAACVKPSTAIKLENAGWGMMLKDVAMMDMHREKMLEQKETSLEISADFPFESKYVEVLGSKMHYIDETDDGRAIAVDLIGMGQSDKPDIDYRFVDHAKYLDAFIEELELENITLVIHDWGSGLGFNYAMQNEDNIKGIAFMEAFLIPITWDEFPAEFRETFQMFRTPGIGEDMIMTQNIFIEQILPGSMLREITEEEMNYYREPYPTVESRKPVWVWPNEIPIDGEPADVHEIVANYNKWLQETEVPKILFYVNPGVLVPAPMVEWSKVNLKNLETIYVGEGIHFIQEDHPHEIGVSLSEWYQTIN